MTSGNPRTTTYTKGDFFRGLIPPHQVVAESRMKPIKHRGTQATKNADDFNRHLGLSARDRLAPTENFESFIAVLPHGLDAMTEGRHPPIDFGQLGEETKLPPGHPKLNIPKIIDAVTRVGFPNEKRDFSNHTAGVDPDVPRQAVSSPGSTMRGKLFQLVSAAGGAVGQMYAMDESSDSEDSDVESLDAARSSSEQERPAASIARA